MLVALLQEIKKSPGLVLYIQTLKWTGTTFQFFDVNENCKTYASSLSAFVFC